VSLLKPYPVLRRVIVNTKTDKSFRGVLWRKNRDFLVLKNAELLGENGSRIPVDGEVAIERANVDFYQVLL
jgi:small nuclear ribonucleoprotein (snRNP)-like protein